MASSRTGTLIYLTEPERVEQREYEVQPPEPGEILTEVERANVCGSELHIWRSNYPEVNEGVLGHPVVSKMLDTGSIPQNIH
jgi:threonine dehydrogenase-like Zn-dependent dehydrogenase